VVRYAVARSLNPDGAIPLNPTQVHRSRAQTSCGRSFAGLAGVLAIAAFAASACGSSSPTTTALDVVPVERAIARSILTERGINTRVSCPARTPAKTGYRFTCVARLDVGTYPVVVAEVNARGGVRYSNNAPLRILDPRSVESAIQHAFLTQRHLKSTVVCPTTILQRRGVTFTCSATTRKGAGLFTVTEVDDSGRVTFIGH